MPEKTAQSHQVITARKPIIAPERPALWEDCVDIFVDPAAVFARRAAGGFGIALFAMTIIAVLLYSTSLNTLYPIIDAQFARSSVELLREHPEISAEHLAQGREMVEWMAPLNYAAGFPIGVVLTGFLLWTIGKLFDASQSLRVSIMIATYAQVPKLIEHLSNAIQGWWLDPSKLNSPYSVSLGLARFLNSETTHPAMLAVLSRADLFTLWVMLLLGLGLSATGRIGKRPSLVAAAIVCLAGAVPDVIQALRA